VAGFVIVIIAELEDLKMGLHQKHKEWIEARGIDAKLAEAFGLETKQEQGANWLAIPYMESGQPINHKYRLTGEKRHRMDVDAPLALWNADSLNEPAVREGKAPLVITEGEWDALAIIQAGHPYAVSVPNGAPSKQTADIETAKRYNWVDRHADALAGVGQFILATDSDEAGQYLRADLVALLGADRCSFCEYPDGCKDLNEVLQRYGQEAVVKCITTARPYPVKGLYRLDDFPERGQVRSYDTGIAELDDLLQIVPGTLTVFTGYANMGKSTLMNSIMARALTHHFPICIASFETDVKPILQDGLLGAMLKCDKQEIERQKDYKEALDILRTDMVIISQAVDEDMEMALEEFLNLCRVAVIRHGAKMIVLDPWNELEHKRKRDETETDYIGRAIRAIKRFAKQYDVAFWIVAHPTKPQEGRTKLPGLYDISGSANWANKADYGLVYHRASKDNTIDNLANIVVTKVRMGLPGRKGKLDVVYDESRSEFTPYNF
jgi:twinkle protein